MNSTQPTPSPKLALLITVITIIVGLLVVFIAISYDTASIINPE